MKLPTGFWLDGQMLEEVGHRRQIILVRPVHRAQTMQLENIPGPFWAFYRGGVASA